MAIYADASLFGSYTKKYGVPETTLRDRVSGRVDIDCCNMGKSPIMSLDEENKLVKHLLEVAKIGTV
jgi:hypothetical protein